MYTNGHHPEVKMVAVSQLPLDTGDDIASLMTFHYPLLIRQAWGDAQAVVGVEAAFTLELPEVQQVLNRLAKLVRGISDTTRDDIAAMVGRQAAEGWSVADLARELRARGVTESEHRSTLIAATETAAAYSQGAMLYYAASGVVSGVEWLTSDPCPICSDLDGKIVALGSAFAPGIDAPPAHPGCRCALAPVLKD